MFIKKIIFVTLFLFSIHGLGAEEKKTLPIVKETIKFKELTEFDACFLIYRAPICFHIFSCLVNKIAKIMESRARPKYLNHLGAGISRATSSIGKT